MVRRPRRSTLFPYRALFRSSADPTIALGALVRRAAEEALGAEFAAVDPAVRRSDRADFQADLAMGLARRAKKPPRAIAEAIARSEEHTSELQSQSNLVCRLL